jgi:alpha-tubulin suppressor-like RCC1 family protein
MAGTNPKGQCSDQGPSSCGTNGVCNGAGACELYPAGTPCGAAATCFNGSAHPAVACDGAGTCSAGTITPCTPYACGPTVCDTSCTSYQDCASGYFCSGTCVNVAGVAAGAGFTCEITSAGGALCWGAAAEGQLGGASTNTGSPTGVGGLYSSGVAALACGGDHTCAITTAGALECWGDNSFGELGNNSYTGTTMPIAVPGMGSGVVAVTAGIGHTCVLNSSGGVMCWGDNQFGELGNNSTTNSLVPVPVSGLSSGVASISAGGYHTCAVTLSGAALCWGSNANGELGNGTTVDSLVPSPVSGLGSGVATISAGGSLPGDTCAVTTAGAALCWGGNADGQLGNNMNTDSSVPVGVWGMSSGVAQIAVGVDGPYVTVCALTTSGAVWCWGNDQYGQVGDGNSSTASRWIPVAVMGLGSGVTAIASGADHACALTSAHTLECWGDNTYGQLGEGGTGGSLDFPGSVREP